MHFLPWASLRSIRFHSATYFWQNLHVSHHLIPSSRAGAFSLQLGFLNLYWSYLIKWLIFLWKTNITLLGNVGPQMITMTWCEFNLNLSIPAQLFEHFTSILFRRPHETRVEHWLMLRITYCALLFCRWTRFGNCYRECIRCSSATGNRWWNASSSSGWAS